MLTNATSKGTGHFLMASMSPSDATTSTRMPMINSPRKTVRHITSHHNCWTSRRGLMGVLKILDLHPSHRVAWKVFSSVMQFWFCKSRWLFALKGMFRSRTQCWSWVKHNCGSDYYNGSRKAESIILSHPFCVWIWKGTSVGAIWLKRVVVNLGWRHDLYHLCVRNLKLPWFIAAH